MAGLLGCFAEMAEAERRAVAARTLARQLGADDMIIFVRDDAVGRSLPAPASSRTCLVPG